MATEAQIRHADFARTAEERDCYRTLLRSQRLGWRLMSYSKSSGGLEIMQRHMTTKRVIKGIAACRSSDYRRYCAARLVRRRRFVPVNYGYRNAVLEHAPGYFEKAH